MKYTNLLLLVLVVFINSCKAQISSKNYNPYKFTVTDTVYRTVVSSADSFDIMYLHGLGYMSTAVGRMVCDIDSSRKDTMNFIDGSTGKERQIISYSLKNCREDTAFYNADRHFFSKIQVYKIHGGKREKIGKEMFGYYVPHQCYEDVPENWIYCALSGLLHFK